MERKLPLVDIKTILKIKHQTYIYVNGEKVSNQTDALKMYRRDIKNEVIICKCCKLEATYFALEYNPRFKWHLNLYGLNTNGNEVMFTKDHRYPLSKTGLDLLKNLQVLCFPCNQKKKDKGYLEFHGHKNE